MRLVDLPTPEMETMIGTHGLVFGVGQFLVRMESRLPDLVSGFRTLYGNYPVYPDAQFADFHVSLDSPGGLRRWWRPQCRFLFDGFAPFKPLPRSQVLPFFEWGLNWTIAGYAHEYLMVHAASVERDGRAIVMPAPPGSGKSTLCAGLIQRGWRLLSDELTLFDTVRGSIYPVARPVGLKNESIAVIRRFAPDAVISDECHDTQKGTVALLRAPDDSVNKMRETSEPAWIIFPKYEKDSPTVLRPRSKAETLVEIATNAFNYNIHGVAGFEVLANVMDRCDCFDLCYSDLDDVIARLGDLEIPSAPH